MAEQAAQRLGRHWTLDDREAPDFVVVDDAARFGLELCRVFSGPEGRKGATTKAAEALAQQRIDALREQYESATATPLSVRLVGCLCDDHLAATVPTLLDHDLSERTPGYATHIQLFECGAQLSVYVRRSFAGHASWLSVNDRVGWVDRDPIARIQKAVRAKAPHLPTFRKRTGLQDQRILIYCDATVNSGKLRLDPGIRIDPAGFDIVYFFPYPEALVVLPAFPEELPAPRVRSP